MQIPSWGVRTIVLAVAPSDVRIYDRALSADEIKRLYNLGTPGR